MASRHNITLLSKAPPGRHICQFHDHVDGLAESVTLFAGTGLRRGDAVVLITQRDHTGPLLDSIKRNGLNPTAAQAAGQLVSLDAEETLAAFMRGGMPDWDRFRKTVGSVLESVSRGRGATRAYGEMVNVLWANGNPAAAIKLEEYWNDLSREHPFALLCAYTLDGLDLDSYRGPLHEIGRTHTDVLDTEADERLREAVDAASEEVLGAAFSLTLSFSGREQRVGEHRLPIGRRTVAWLQRNMPAASQRILERARTLMAR